MTKKINNRIVANKEHDTISKAAEKIVKESIAGMFKKLCKLKHVELFYDDDDKIYHTSEMNSDTAFREFFYDMVEDEIRKGFWNL